ncbi:MAG: HD domain-containing protein [Candidatus Gracilibacteria bacterium]|jgi:uncharacterized protein
MRKIQQEAKKLISGSHASHSWEHTLRVYNLAVHIGKKERADLKILEAAALLHDIARHKEDLSGGKIDHAEMGALMAEKILKKYKFSQKEIEKIKHCIVCHRFRGKNIPKSKEAKILFDADKLDSIGAVGIGRTYLFAGEIGSKLHNDKNTNILKTKAYTKEDTGYREFVFKLSKIKDRMLTREGKRLAKERHKFMVEFFDRFKKEIEGKL